MWVDSYPYTTTHPDRLAVTTVTSSFRLVKEAPLPPARAPGQDEPLLTCASLLLSIPALPPWFYPGPMGDLECSTMELLLVARAGQIDHTKCTNL
jgi:hypothetical protein